MADPVLNDEPIRVRPPRRPGYLLIRGTGLILTVLALGHFALTHLITDVADTGGAFIAARWSNALWVIWDGALLLAALAHVDAGMSTVLRDLAPQRIWLWLPLLHAVMLALTLLGLATLVMYQFRR